MTEVTLEDLRRIAHLEADFMSGRPQIRRHYNEDESLFVDVAEFRDIPEESFTSYATIGMSQFDTGFTTRDGAPIRVELLALARGNTEAIAAALSTSAFNVGSGDYQIALGAIFPDVIRMYLPDAAAGNGLFVAPFSWPGHLEDLPLGNSVVTWLQLVPVTDQELDVARRDGVEALMQALAERDTDITDLYRQSVV